MEIQKNQLIQFAGAGILKDSDPEKEYIETEKKLQAIAQFL